MGVAVNLTINRTEYQTGFTKVPNSLIHSQKISMKAKMLMTYLIGQRDSSFTPVSENDRWTMTLKACLMCSKNLSAASSAVWMSSCERALLYV